MNLILSLFLFLGLTLQQMPGANDDEPHQGTFVLTNAHIETVTNGAIDNGMVVIQNGRITAVGQNVQVPTGAEVIDCSGLSVYPGLIDSGTHLGLAEIGSVAESNDFRELGDITPQMKALTAVNPNSTLIPVTRVNGVTTVITEPEGGTFPGQTALINLHGYTPEQMLVGGAEMMKLDFPNTGRFGRFDRRTDEQIEKQAKEAMKRLNDTWSRAVLYHRIDSAYTADPNRTSRPEYVPEMDALLPVVRGEMPLMVTVDRAEDIQKAIKWVQGNGIKNVVFSGVAEGWRVADDLAAAGIPVLVGPVLATPTRASDRYDKAYANAGLLHDAGVKVAIRTGEAENVRNLPYNAGFAAAYGLGREEALRAVTINPAQIFGVDDEVGSIEEGKMANVIVTDGDPFETKTQVMHLFIDGYKIPLDSQQLRLYHEFLDRNPGLEKHPETQPAGTH